MAIKSVAKKKTVGRSSVKSKINFEQALEQLQQVVGDLEEGQLSLSDSLEAYEKGVQLLKVCHKELDNAEQKIQILTSIDEEGRVEVQDFDDSATIDHVQGQGTRRKSGGSKASTGRAMAEAEDSESDDWGEDESDSEQDGRLF